MHYSYTTKGTCSSEIEFDLDGDICLLYTSDAADE